MGLRANGSLALGVTGRCLSLLGPSDLDDEYATARHRLDTASVDELPACARTQATFVSVRQQCSSPLRAEVQSHRLITRNSLRDGNVLARTEPNERNSAPSVNSRCSPITWVHLTCRRTTTVDSWQTNQFMTSLSAGTSMQANSLEDSTNCFTMMSCSSPLWSSPRRRAKPSPCSTSTPQARRFLVSAKFRRSDHRQQ